MSNAIALETSGRIGSVAAVQNGIVLTEETFAHGLKHAAEVIPMIDRLCKAQGWSPADVTELYVSAAPGSFTGLRIGITLAKTLAFARGTRIVAVPSLRVLAENAPPEAQNLIVVLDAKRDQIFTARLQRQLGIWIEKESAHLSSLTESLALAPRPVHLLGEGIPYHQKFIPVDDPTIIICPLELAQAHAASVAKIGVELAAAGHYADPYTLAPIYIRMPEAQEKWERTHTHPIYK